MIGVGVGCRDVVEQALPVVLGLQWGGLQHHSLADKLQVGGLHPLPNSLSGCLLSHFLDMSHVDMSGH